MKLLHSILTVFVQCLGEIDITWDNCQDVLAAADMFGITCVVTECTKFLKKHLDNHNCVGMYCSDLLAKYYSCDKILHFMT